MQLQGLREGIIGKYQFSEFCSVHSSLDLNLGHCSFIITNSKILKIPLILVADS